MAKLARLLSPFRSGMLFGISIATFVLVIVFWGRFKRSPQPPLNKEWNTNTKQQSENPISRWWGWTLSGDSSGFYTFGLIAVGTVQVWLFYRQLIFIRISLVDMKKAAQAAKRQARLARDTLTTTQRAFVSIDGFNIELTVLSDLPDDKIDIPKESLITDPATYITRLAVQPRWRNSGNTPTKNMKIRINWCGPAEQTPPIYRLPNDCLPFFIPPKAMQCSKFVRLEGANAIVIHQTTVPQFGPEPPVCIWGRADYEDIFGGVHFYKWCYRVRLERHRRGRVGATLIQYGDFNRSD